MLKNIKAMILEKESELENAELIAEEVTFHHVEDEVLLQENHTVTPVFLESDDDDEDDEEESKELDDSDILDKKINDDEPDDDEDEEDEEPPIEDAPISDEEDGDEEDPETPSLDSEEEPAPPEEDEDLGNAELPDPIGAQTGDPIQNDNDLLSTEIDLGSNTMKDTLPVPPDNASDVVDSDEHHVDAGFGNEPIEDDTDEIELSDKLQDLIDRTNGTSVRIDELKDLLRGSSMMEAISIGDDNIDSDTNNDNKEDEKDTEEKPDEETPPDDNLVTQAVKDKVAELEGPTDEPMSDGNTDAPTSSAATKDAIFKKLSKLTKDIEDAKSQLIDQM